MTFIHQPLVKSIILPDKTVDGYRTYITPEGNEYASVTTILGATGDGSFLEAWRERIGHEAADKKSKQASDRGTKVHQAMEDYLNNILDLDALEPMIRLMIQKCLKPIKENVDIVHNIEFGSYSDRLKTAGRCDLLCTWNGVLSILDFKTSDKWKREEWLTDYFLQETTYSMMLKERDDLNVPQIITFLVTAEEPHPQIVIKQAKDYHIPVIKRFRSFYK